MVSQLSLQLPTSIPTNPIMYTYSLSSSSPSSLSLLKGASKLRFLSSLSKPFSISNTPPSSVSFSNQKFRTSSFSSALWCIRRSTAPWSHGVDWRSPPSLRVQARVAAPVAPHFATMGMAINIHNVGSNNYERLDDLLYFGIFRNDGICPGLLRRM